MLAGCNGAGKSSIGGAAFRAAGADYFNPDEAARAILAANASRASIAQEQANGAAWAEGKRLLERAIRERCDFAFETTLGGNTIAELLLAACEAGIEVHIWFAGLETVELHVERVKQRVASGGHDIPEPRIRARFDRGRKNLIRLLPHVTSLRLFDNSTQADPARGHAPQPRLLVAMVRGRITAPRALRTLLDQTPDWAKPIVTAALKGHLRRRGRRA
ncbi:MAG TPA: zeta toxin family protein [Casimicrobiaceae bacterium]